MWIQELAIKNFGKFSNETIVLQPGINLIYGENESGKSTLHAFIRACFFGMKKMRGRASKTDAFARYQPWEHPGYYAGRMRFVSGKKVFRLERDFTKGPQHGTLVCETDGECLSLENGDLQMLLGGVGEVIFDNTVSVEQLKNETDEGLAIELKNYMANLEGTGDASIRVEKALLFLKAEKKRAEKRQQELKQKEQACLQVLESKISFLQDELQKDEDQLHRVQEQLHQVKEVKVEINEKHETDSWLIRFWKWIQRWLGRIFGRDRKQNPAKDRYQKKARIQGKIEQLEGQIQEKKVLIENYQQEIVLQTENQSDSEAAGWKLEGEACALAMVRIQEVVSDMQMDVGQFLKERTSEIFSELTDYKYNWVEIREHLTLGVHGSDHFVPANQLSKGTLWQLYFALRMAANEVLGQEENLPVILDDAFAMYDDVRLEKVLGWLARQRKQVILLTCQKREKEWMERSGIKFHEVVLS